MDRVPPGSAIAWTEIFGPVMRLMHVRTVEEAVALVNSGQYGNMACLFTQTKVVAERWPSGVSRRPMEVPSSTSGPTGGA